MATLFSARPGGSAGSGRANYNSHARSARQTAHRDRHLHYSHRRHRGTARPAPRPASSEATPVHAFMQKLRNRVPDQEISSPESLSRGTYKAPSASSSAAADELRREREKVEASLRKQKELEAQLAVASSKAREAEAERKAAALSQQALGETRAHLKDFEAQAKQIEGIQATRIRDLVEETDRNKQTIEAERQQLNAQNEAIARMKERLQNDEEKDKMTHDEINMLKAALDERAEALHREQDTVLKAQEVERMLATQLKEEKEMLAELNKEDAMLKSSLSQEKTRSANYASKVNMLVDRLELMNGALKKERADAVLARQEADATIGALKEDIRLLRHSLVKAESYTLHKELRQTIVTSSERHRELQHIISHQQAEVHRLIEKYKGLERMYETTCAERNVLEQNLAKVNSATKSQDEQVDLSKMQLRSSVEMVAALWQTVAETRAQKQEELKRLREALDLEKQRTARSQVEIANAFEKGKRSVQRTVQELQAALAAVKSAGGSDQVPDDKVSSATHKEMSMYKKYIKELEKMLMNANANLAFMKIFFYFERNHNCLKNMGVQKWKRATLFRKV